MKWFHAIGICGKTTGNIAKMFMDMGWFVTGSDIQYFPPMSDQLKKWDIPTVEGYNYTHLTKEFWVEQTGKKELEIGEYPDLCMFMESITKSNKEYLFAKKKGLDIRPFSQILGEYLIKPQSIVIIGTAGKTTTTALTVRLLQELNLDPSYMIGAEVIDIPDSLKNTSSNWSVIEGDEYHNPELSNGAKFLEFKPKYLVITNIGWEHQDIFPTQERYIKEFTKCIELVPQDGLIIVHAGDKNIEIALKNAKVRAKIIKYKLEPEDLDIKGEVTGESQRSGTLFDNKKLVASNVSHEDIGENADGQTWLVRKLGNDNVVLDNNGEEIIRFQTSLLGDYNLENILASIILILNTPSENPTQSFEEDLEMLNTIKETIKNFKGPKKRLEILHQDKKLIVVDDFGVAPNRAENSLKTLKENFPHFNIIAVFEPNSGSRLKDKETFNKMYKQAFINANEVIIPDLSNHDELVTSEEMTSRLINLGVNAKYIPSELLLNYLEQYKKGDNKTLVVFFSSYRLTKLAEEFSK